MDAIGRGAQMAVSDCQNTFRWDRWNCPDSIFSRLVQTTHLLMQTLLSVIINFQEIAASLHTRASLRPRHYVSRGGAFSSKKLFARRHRWLWLLPTTLWGRGYETLQPRYKRGRSRQWLVVGRVLGQRRVWSARREKGARSSRRTWFRSAGQGSLTEQFSRKNGNCTNDYN